MQNDYFVFNIGTSSLEVRNIRLVNRITSMTKESRIRQRNIFFFLEEHFDCSGKFSRNTRDNIFFAPK